MDESNLLVLAISCLLGFVIFKKDTSTTLEESKKGKNQSKRATPQKNAGNSTDSSESELSGVSKYLNVKEALDVEENSIESGVSKYLTSKEKTSLSGVSKYMVKQSIEAKKKAKENISGVEKYLKNNN